jgi:XRE family transcriptional regulator, master regulator for biofilm formation
VLKNRIKECRLQKKFSITDLSEKSGVSRSYICLLENGCRKNPTQEVMNKISEALGKSVQTVFFSKGNKC